MGEMVSSKPAPHVDVLSEVRAKISYKHLITGRLTIYIQVRPTFWRSQGEPENVWAVHCMYRCSFLEPGSNIAVGSWILMLTNYSTRRSVVPSKYNILTVPIIDLMNKFYACMSITDWHWLNDDFNYTQILAARVLHAKPQNFISIHLSGLHSYACPTQQTDIRWRERYKWDTKRSNLVQSNKEQDMTAFA